MDENSPFNTTVGYLSAFDYDSLNNFGSIIYELKNGQNLFQIEKQTGRIYTVSNDSARQLDRESIDVFHMNVDAIDGGFLRTSVQVIVKLNDLNDNPPLFVNNVPSSFALKKKKTTNSSYSLIGVIEENSSKWIEPIRLQALDQDLDFNSQIVYEIVESDFLVDYFAIDAKTNFVVLKEGQQLDFEKISQLHSMKNLFKIQSPIVSDSTVDEYILASDEIDINLIVKAKDLGTPSLYSLIAAKIIVKVILNLNNSLREIV